MKRLIAGETIPKENFIIKEINNINFNSFLEMKHKKILGFKIPRSISAEEAKIIETNFHENDHVYPRKDLDDHLYLGNYIARKTLDQYFKDAKEKDPQLEMVFHGTTNVMQMYLNKIKLLFSENGITFRKAEYKDKQVTPYTLHQWIRNKESRKYGLSLPLHDDLSLIYDPRFNGFEIQNSKDMFSINLCIKNTNKLGGKLNIVNLLPDINLLKRDKNTWQWKYGSPYKDIDISQYNVLSTPIESKDLFIINGETLHGVSDLVEDGDVRLGFSLFAGYLSDTEIIYWE